MTGGRRPIFLNPSLPWAVPDDPDLHPINATYGDEMDEVPLDAAWTKRNVAQSETLTASTLLTVSAATAVVFDAQGDGLWRPAPADTNFELVIGMKSDGFGGMTGLGVIDTNGTGVGFSAYNDGNAYTWSITTYGYASTGNSIASGAPGLNAWYWLALRKNGTTYTGRISKDGGLTWSGSTGGHTWTGTPHRVGVGRFFSSAGSNHQLRRFNVHPGPGFFTP